jgi:hypothetical protein
MNRDVGFVIAARLNRNFRLIHLGLVFEISKIKPRCITDVKKKIHQAKVKLLPGV